MSDHSKVTNVGAALGLGLVALIGACSSSVDPDQVDPPGTTKPPASLAVIMLPPNHPPFFNDSVAFYARVDRQSQGAIYFTENGGERGEKFAELKIDNGTLVAAPDGTPYGPNDSVLIVMKIAGDDTVGVELRPSGIHFSTDKPARLKIEYDESDGDFDHNGKVDDEDEQVEQRLAIWRQENPGDPAVKIGTVKTEGARELQASLTSFSRYWIAY